MNNMKPHMNFMRPTSYTIILHILIQSNKLKEISRTEIIMTNNRPLITLSYPYLDFL